MKSFLSNFSAKIALSSVVLMSTMSCVFAFFVWSLIPLIWPNATGIVAYVSADIIQLVALPLIMVGQKLANDNHQDQRAENHEEVTSRQEVLDEKINTMLEHITDIIDHLEVQKIYIAPKD